MQAHKYLLLNQISWMCLICLERSLLLWQLQNESWVLPVRWYQIIYLRVHKAIIIQVNFSNLLLQGSVEQCLLCLRITVNTSHLILPGIILGQNIHVFITYFKKLFWIYHLICSNSFSKSHEFCNLSAIFLLFGKNIQLQVHVKSIYHWNVHNSTFFRNFGPT